MLPTLTMIIAAYVMTRMMELLANESARGEASRTLLQAAAAITMLVAFGGCTLVQFSGSNVGSP